MPNVTISIPEALYKKMKRHSEVRWSEVVRKALVEYVSKLEAIERGVVFSDDLAEILKESELDVSRISLERAIEHYEKVRELEWKRSSTIRARS